jgi:hypothetical protein
VPTIEFYPKVSAASDGLKVLKSRQKKVVTMDIGPFYAKETVLYNSYGAVSHSSELRSLAPYRCTFGYDVLVYVGRALFLDCRTEQQIIAALRRKNISISPREIGYLGRKFIIYLAIAHRHSRQQLRKVMAHRGGYILHIDGTCEGDSPHLFTGIDGIAQIVLDNIKIPSEKAELLIPFFRQIKQQYGDPIALVHDMGKGILSAVRTVFKGIPDFICHFHFLRDIGKDLLEEDYAIIRKRLKTHKIRAMLRRKAKALSQNIGDDLQAAARFWVVMENSSIDDAIMDKMPAMAAYAMIHWTFDKSELSGCGFPFDCPHLIFYQRLKKLYDLINARRIKDKRLSRLWRPLTKVIEDQQLKKAALRMQEKVEMFEKLREALSIAESNSKGLNDDGQGADIKSIEEKVKQFRNEMITDNDDYKKMAEQIDKYWEKLFADPITVTSPLGEITIQPQRTNNILERFFRDLKRGARRRSGTVSMNKTLRYMLTDTPIVKNLNNPEYVEIILNGCRTLEERFEKIDSRLVVETLKAEQGKQKIISTEMKKIIKLPDLPERLDVLFVA